jgi:hypothetical protein
VKTGIPDLDQYIMPLSTVVTLDPRTLNLEPISLGNRIAVKPQLTPDLYYPK